MVSDNGKERSEMSFRFDLKTLILFGTGSIKELGEEAAKLGHKAMIITYPDIRRIGLLDMVVEDLRGKNIEVIVFDKVEPNPRTTTVDEGAEIARKENIDLVIGLGGGSVMDAAKGIALACSGTASIWDYWLNRTEAKGIVPPIIQVSDLNLPTSPAKKFCRKRLCGSTRSKSTNINVRSLFISNLQSPSATRLPVPPQPTITSLGLSLPFRETVYAMFYLTFPSSLNRK
jgi:hypothetical protein